jgi:hypothetical protein
MDKISINKVCDLFTGFPLSSKDFAEAGELSVVQIRDVDQFAIRTSDLQTTDKPYTNNKKLLRVGDILFKARGPRLEAFALPFQPKNTIATNAFIILRPKAELLPRYTAWLLNNMNFSRITQQTHVIQSISLKQLAEIEIPVPDRHTQSKIIEVHDEIEAGRLLANRYFDAASEMLRGNILKVRGQ